MQVETKDKKHPMGAFYFGAGDGTQPPLASYLLDHPNASHFGTGLRTFLLKNSPLDYFS